MPGEKLWEGRVIELTSHVLSRLAPFGSFQNTTDRRVLTAGPYAYSLHVSKGTMIDL